MCKRICCYEEITHDYLYSCCFLRSLLLLIKVYLHYFIDFVEVKPAAGSTPSPFAVRFARCKSIASARLAATGCPAVELP